MQSLVIPSFGTFPACHNFKIGYAGICRTALPRHQRSCVQGGRPSFPNLSIPAGHCSTVGHAGISWTALQLAEPNTSQISSMAIKHPSILSAWSALCLNGVLSLVLPSSATIPVGHIETLRFWISFLHTVALYVDVTDQNQGCEILVLIVGSSSLSFWLASMSCNRRS